MNFGRRGKLITFSGIDGCGKSTQIDLLASRIRGEGRQVWATWYRPGYSKELDALRAWFRRRRPNAMPKSGSAREHHFARRGVSEAWVVLALMDTLVHYGVKVRARQLAGIDVLSDRYTLDAVLDLKIRFPHLTKLVQGSALLIQVLAPKPDVAILLDLGLEEAGRRLEQKDEPFPDSEAVRQRRHDAYQNSRSLFCVLSASQAPEQIAKAIWDRVQDRI